MEFGLSEEQTLLQDSVNRFLQDQVPLDTVRKIAAGDIDDSSVWQGLTELGIPGLLIPENLGGVGLGTMEAAIISELLGYNVTPSPFISSAVIAPTVLLSANKREDLVSNIASGTCRIGIAFGEAMASRNDAGVSAANGKLNGTSIFVLDSNADHYLVAANDKQLYLVNKDVLGRKNLTSIDKTRSTCELSFNDAEAELISDDVSVFENAIDIGRIMLSADSLGAGQNMIDQAVTYAKGREQFDRAIATFQAVKHMCAEMAAGLEPCRSMVWYAAHAFDDLPNEARLTACHTKAHVSEVATFVARTSTEVHGGMGFTDLVGLHYWFKRIGFNRQLLGSPELLREQAARLQGLAA
ncbi:MAG: acyl-CoA dehydrogenase family protein [bacterium]|nr:acyl-CoA dehydrogenase [Gammaproteobacteria bacterium]